MLELLVVIVPLAMLVLTAVGFALTGLLEYRLAGLVSPERRVAIALAVIGLGALLSVALTSRTLDEMAFRDGGLVVTYDDYAGGFAASRWLSLVLLGAALIEIVRGWLRARGAAIVDPAWPLLASLLLYDGGTLLVQAFGSEHPGFSHKALYLPILLAAIYYQPVSDLPRVLGAAKLVILALVVGSLLGIVLRPEFVLHRPDPGVIPGIDWRLYGLTAHANTLGPVALIGLILELYSPYRVRLMRLINLAAPGAVLVLAQSRTAWGVALLICLAVAIPLALAPSREPTQATRAFRRAVWTLVGCIALAIAAACAVVALGGLEYLQRRTDLGTLNGRFQIWDITLQAWRENELLGYGPGVWGIERQQHFNMFHVGQAHNQFIQTLGEAGLVGLALLLVHLGVLAYVAWRTFGATRGLVLALMLVLLVRCITEAPMRTEGLLSWSAFLHVVLLVAASHALRASQRRTIPIESRRPLWRRGGGAGPTMSSYRADPAGTAS